MKLTAGHFLGIAVVGSLLVGGTLVRNKQWYLGKRDFSLPAEAAEKFERPFFKDITSHSGIDHINERAPVDQMLFRRLDTFFVSPGVAIADWNNDGFQDVFLPATSPLVPNKLYLNQKDNSFREVAEKWGVAWNRTGKLAAITATAFDYNDDGRSDLLLTGMGCTHLWRNDGDRFKDVSLGSGLADCQNALAGIPYDINADGKLDVYLLRYWGPQDMFALKDPHIYVNNLYNATNGGKNGVYINRGDGTFSDETSTRGGDDGHWSYDATFADFDLDGVVDMYISNDYGPDQLYELREGKFINRSDKFEVPDRRYGMNTSLGDLENDQKPHIYISNAYDGPPYGLSGNFLWKIRHGKASEEAMEKNVQNCGFAWGASFVDWNVDGWTDLYVANGFISTKIEQSTQIPRNLEREANLFNMLQIRTLPGEFSSDIRNWISFTKDTGLHHKQRDCLFMNYENKFMVNMAEKHGLDPYLGDNRAVGVLDMDNDGDLDMIVTSRNVRTMAWENTTNPKSQQWIGFKLLGAAKVPLTGTGARVTVEQDGIVQTRWHTGGRNGFLASSDLRLHFGLRGQGVLKVTVYWPDGKISTWDSLEPGKYHDLDYRQKLD